MNFSHVIALGGIFLPLLSMLVESFLPFDAYFKDKH